MHGAADAVGVAEEVGLTSVDVGVGLEDAFAAGVDVKTGSVVHDSELLGVISDNLQSLPLYVNVTFVISAFCPFVQEPYCHGGGGVYVTVQSDVGVADALGKLGGKVVVAVADGKTGGAEVVAVGAELGKLGGNVSVGVGVRVASASPLGQGGGPPVLIQ